MMLSLCVAVAAQADTIVLKSGRRIRATTVIEEGDRVYYDTSAGRLSLRKSVVDHIERGASVDFSGSGSGGGGSSAAEALSKVSAPAGEAPSGFDDVVKATLAGGSIDRNYIAKLESEAQGGNAQAVMRVEVAHFVAARFEFDKGDVDQAIAHLRRGLTFAPNDAFLLINLGYLQIRQSQYTAAIDSLERARRADAKSLLVAKFLGLAYYDAGKNEQAVAEWKRGLALGNDDEMKYLLQKAQADQAEEASYKEGVTAHFNLKYNGSTSAPALARDVLRTLEQHFSSISSDLNYSPPESISVILYTDQAFQDITHSPGWVGALNDGRIRVPVQGLTGMTSELNRTLKHELTHSFIDQKTGRRCPTWLHEGLAQYEEGQRSRDDAAAFLQAFDKQKITVPLAALEGSWMSLDSERARVAYAWGLAVVEHLVSQYGMGDVVRLLDHMKTDGSPEQASRNALRMDYQELQEGTVKYLRRTYGH
jgi:predicted negative regulator of RcsB-dependent stress response